MGAGSTGDRLCHVIMTEGLYETSLSFLDFCKVTDNYAASYDEKIDALQQFVKPYTPGWAEGISGVPADKITMIAREFAIKGPACVISYRGGDYRQY